VSTGESNAL